MNKIYLCKPGGVMLGVLNGIDENTASLKMSVSESWELTFDIGRYTEENGKLVETSYYLSVSEMMELYTDIGSDKIRFIIDTEPTITGDGKTERKNVTAHSIEQILLNKYLRNFKINCGVKQSQEYLLGYYDDEDNFVGLNLNPYTNLPVDYIVVYNDYADCLREAKAKIQSMTFAIKTDDGKVVNEPAASYLWNLCNEFPRLECDPQPDGSCKIYAHFNGDEVYIDLDPVNNNYTKSYLLSGIDNLIQYYDTYGKQLSLIDLAFENASVAGWSVGNIPESVRHKKFFFDINEQDVLSFFKQECTKTMKVLFDFNRFERKIDIIDIANETNERDTGIFLTFRNLIQEINITSSSEEGMKTKFYPTGANDLGILFANFGEPYIINLDWFMDKVNEYGEYQYVSAGLHDRYHQWMDFRNTIPVSLTVNGETQSFANRREAYRELTRQYNQFMVDIDALKNKLPDDSCEIDYTTFPFKDLNIAFKAYMNALEALENMYRSDYNVAEFNRNTLEAVDVNGNPCTSIKDTFYWHDFQCYVGTIIPNVEAALLQYVNTKGYPYLNDADPDQYDQEKGEWIEWEGGNPLFKDNPQIVTENMSDEYLYDMSLYGTVELELKIKAWRNNAAVIYKPGFVLDLSNHVVDPVPLSGFKYNTPDETGWNRLDDEQKSAFTGQSAFEMYLNKYLDYMSIEVRQNSLTKKENKGVVHMGEDALAELQPQVDAMLQKQENIQKARMELADAVALDQWSEPGFTDDDLKKIHMLLSDANYQNANILITNLDDVVTTVDVQEELYQDSLIALSEKSRPQLHFEISSDNLFALEDFKPLADQTRLLNFIRVSIGLYEDEFEKLRIIGITLNPMIPTPELTLEFSNMTYSLQDSSDLAFLFDSMDGTGSGSSSSNGSGSGGTFGSNDAEITIANNMLNALLKSKPYAATVGRTIVQNIIENVQNNKELIYSSGIFDRLRTGEIVVSGDCVTDAIKSTNYSEWGGSGSGLNLKDGTFSYADGKLTYKDGKLSLDSSVEIKGSGGDSSDLVTSDKVILSINNSTEEISINAAKVDLTGYVTIRSLSSEGTTEIDGGRIKGGTLKLGGAENGNGVLEIYDASGELIGSWDNSGITASNANILGRFSNGKNYLDTNGNFSLGNGALEYNPTKYNDNNIHLTNNMSLIYDGVSLVGENISNSILMGYREGDPRKALDQETADLLNIERWNTSDGVRIFTKTAVSVIKTPFSIFVFIKFWISGTDRSITKDSKMFIGLPHAAYSGLPVEYKFINRSGYFNGTTKMGHLEVYDSNSSCIVVDQAITGNTTSQDDFWVCYFSYYPKQNT